MTTRRELIAGALAAGLPVSALGRPKRPSVQAEVTIFYGHPGAETVLVRFYVLDVDAPAGRLRVFDRSGRRILGTAAVLASRGRMFGELWLPIRARTEILTELEAPGLSRPLRSSHIIQPLPRWTVHWLIIINQAEIEATLAATQPTQSALRNAVLQSMGAQINPLKNNDPMALDHYSFLSQGRSAAHLSQLTGLPVSQTAIGPSALFGLRTAPRIFKAFGVSNGVIEPSAAGPDFGRLVSIDGSPFPLAFLHADATPQNLGFYDGRDAMSRNVERWLTRTPAFRAPQYEPRVAVMASTTLDERLGDVSDAIQEWNRLYAYPRIETGRADLLFQRTPPKISTSSAEPAPFRPPPGPTIEEIIAANAQRQQDVESNSANALLALLKVADLEGGTAVSLAENIETNWPGLVVFNPSPFPRTEVIDLPDGSVRVAHSVPSHGYSYLPDIGSEAGTAVEDPGAMIARGQHVTIRLDPETGAIASLFHRDRRTEWVRSDSEGLNAIEDSRLESFTRIRLDRVGVRLVAVRSVSGATMITTITVYDDLPWVDIVNTTDLHQDSNFPVAFSFALDNPTVAWETPLGAGSHATPIGAISHLRWARIGAEHEWHVLFRGIDSPYIACNTSGRMVSLSSGKRERYRLQIHSPDPLADVPFEFGWGAEPMATAPVVRSARSNRPTLLPRFGQLLRTSEGGINIFTVKPSDDGTGIVIYLQDTIGLSRDVPILGRLLAFDRAEILDIEENTVEEIPISEPAHVNVPVAAFGITAVRLTGAFDPGG